MKTIVTTLIFILSFILIVPFSFGQFGDGWEFLKETEGIKVWSKPSPNSKFKQVLIKSNYDATLSTMVSIGRDILSFPKWVYKNIGVKILEEESEQVLVYHSVSDMPWPIEDRDAVIRYTVRQDPATKKVYVDSRLVPDHPYEHEGVVRADDYHAQWVLTPLANNKVEVVLCVNAAPGGSIPAWLGNLFLDKGPIETFKGLRRLSQVEPYKSASFNFIVNK